MVVHFSVAGMNSLTPKKLETNTKLSKLHADENLPWGHFDPQICKTGFLVA